MTNRKNFGSYRTFRHQESRDARDMYIRNLHAIGHPAPVCEFCDGYYNVKMLDSMVIRGMVNITGEEEAYNGHNRYMRRVYDLNEDNPIVRKILTDAGVFE